MIDKLKSNLTNAYMMFILGFADPSTVDKSVVEAEMKGKISEVFNTQKNCDRAKRLLKGNFAKMLALYFHQFNSTDGFDHLGLDKELAKNKKHLLRHLGKDKLQYLNLIVSLMKTADEIKPEGVKLKKGLLAS
jgi:hypothetical protein